MKGRLQVVDGKYIKKNVYFSGEISFFRIGCAPQDHVENLFEEAKKEVNFKPEIIVEKNLN